MTRPKSTSKAVLALLVALVFVSAANMVSAQTARARAMGGAFIGLSDDEGAIYYNPAGLSQIQGREGSIHGKANETDVFNWRGIAFTGHIYEDSDENRFSITDYLEHNILEDPLPRKPKYSYGVAYDSSKMYEKYSDLLGNPGVSQDTSHLRLAFGTRFPVAKRMLTREQLFAGITLDFNEVEDKYAKLSKKRKSAALGAGFLYHYNDRITGGITVDNILQHLEASGGQKQSKDDAIFSMGAAYKVTEGTIIAADIYNLGNTTDATERQLRVGVEKKFIENDLTMRMGSHNGTLTLGFGISLLPNVRMDYSYYDGEHIAEHYAGVHMSFD